jgi:hypothetical protein
MGILERISDIEAEINRTQKNKGKGVNYLIVQEETLSNKII